MSQNSLIVAGVRTPIGATNGSLASVSAPRLGAVCMESLLSRTGMEGRQIDEVVIGNVLSIPAEKVNVFGGAIALGHPIGCSGARILVTLLNALNQTGARRGIASLCIGGGEAVALAIETVV